MNGSGGYVKLHRSLLDHPLVTQLPAGMASRLRGGSADESQLGGKPGVWWIFAARAQNLY